MVLVRTQRARLIVRPTHPRPTSAAVEKINHFNASLSLDARTISAPIISQLDTRLTGPVRIYHGRVFGRPDKYHRRRESRRTTCRREANDTRTQWSVPSPRIRLQRALNNFTRIARHKRAFGSVSLGRRPRDASQVRLWRHMGFQQINGSLPPPHPVHPLPPSTPVTLNATACTVSAGKLHATCIT
ncbi:unnamed protein product, partial [Iphiclides podalirius]